MIQKRQGEKIFSPLVVYIRSHSTGIIIFRQKQRYRRYFSGGVSRLGSMGSPTR